MRTPEKERYRAARAKGLCGRCMRVPALPGAGKCLGCKQERLEARAARIKAGLCARCTKPAAKGRVQCRECQEDQNKRNLARSRKRRRAGKCTKCGEPSKNAMCATCTENHSRTNDARRAAFRRAGLCENCGRRPVMMDRVRCEECLESRNTRARQKNATPEGAAACRARAKATREKLIAEGRCYRCGADELVDGLKVCGECRDKQQARNMIRELKLKTARAVAAKAPPRASQQQPVDIRVPS